MKFFGFYILFFGLLLVSCNKEDPPECQGKYDHEKINGNIFVTAEKDSSVLLKMITEEEYPCYNYVIDYCFKKENDVIKVNLLGHYEPEICLTAIGPARANIDLGHLKNGVYQVTFYFNKEISEAQLLVEEQEARLEFDKVENVKPD